MPAVRFPTAYRAVLVLVGAATLLAAAPAAAGTFPGKNGKIAYGYLGTIYTIAPGDGGGEELVTDPDGGGNPSWSPDGGRLAFESTRGGHSDIYVIDADGTDERRLTSNDAIDEEDPSWLDNDTVIFRADPDSGDPSFSTVDLGAAPTSTYAFYRAPEPGVVDNFTRPEISAGGQLMFTEYFQVPGTSSFRSAAWTASGNGTASNVSGTDEAAWSGGWSPDGIEFLYTRTPPGCCDIDVFVDSASSAPVDITNSPGRSEMTPKFSPDGTMVVFGDNSNLYLSNADGSGETTLPTGFFDARDPDWQPLGGTTPPPDPDPDPDKDPPDLRLTGKKRQSSKKKVVVKASCDEACSVEVEPKGKANVTKRGALRAGASVNKKLKLKAARADLAAGETGKLTLKFKGRKTKKLIKETLKRKKGKIRLKLQATATDGSGNRETANFKVKLQK